MTPVKFEFLGPDGTPVANQVFEIKLPKSGFLSASDGVVMPDTLHPTTDENGSITIELAPSSTPYFLKVISDEADAENECCVPGIFFKFYVPVLEAPVTEVRVQDLIVDPPPSTKAYDEAALVIIIDAKVHAMASAAAALVSEQNAKLSEDAAAAFSEAAGNDAEAAGLSAEAAALSEGNSKASEDASKAAELAAEQSATEAQASAEFAAGVIQDAQEQVDEATRQAGLAAGSASQAKLSENASAGNAALTAADVVTSADNVVASDINKQATAADVVAVTALKGETADLKTQAEIARDEAVAAASQAAGAFVDGGLIDLSGGAYPPKPTASTIWRVSVGGTVTSVPEGTITYRAGDNLVYTLTDDVFYKTDNNQGVVSVNGRQGVVTLTSIDVGLPKVNNTSDMEKPVSDAQALEFNKRTPTVGTLDTTAGRLVKVGDYGENGGSALSRVNTVSANSLTVPGLYAFLTGGLDLPEASVYVKHMSAGVAGSAKQLAWGVVTDKTYVRTQIDTVWGDWAPSTEIVDNLTSTDANKALSAKQGKVLKDLVDAAGAGGSANVIRYTYNVSAGQTLINGNDLSGVSLKYTVGVPLFVDLNGQPLWLGNDYAAATGTSITLTAPAEVAGEISITVITAKGVNDTYTKAEIDGKIGNSALPVGLPMAWPLSEATIPGGMLAMNGQLLSRAVWPTLWALYSPQAVTDAVWLADPLQRGKPSSGDGSTTFRLPDFNGKHADGLTPAAAVLRGYGKNSAGTPGLFQFHQVQGHEHGATSASSNPFALTAPSGTGPSVAGWYFSTGFVQRTGPQVASSGIITDGPNGTPLVGAETRGTNVTVIWVVVAATALQNVGTVDVLALANKVEAQSALIADLSLGFISAPQVFTLGGQITLAHGLGAAPKRITLEAVCITAQNGWLPGDVLPLGESTVMYNSTGGYSFGHSFSYNATNVVLTIATSGLAAISKDTKISTALVPASWRLVVSASKA